VADAVIEAIRTSASRQHCGAWATGIPSGALHGAGGQRTRLTPSSISI